jgi:MFS family permease
MAAGPMGLSTSIDQAKAINPWLIAITVTLATFMELLDTAIANVSLPHIAGGLATSYDESTWVLTSYLVANAVVLPLSAWLSRVFGRKNYYMTCVALFSASSLMCGLAPNLGLLIFAYSYLPKDENNKASSLTNLFRNQGGSFGIAFVTTVLARRAQYHQSVLVTHVTSFDRTFSENVLNIANRFVAHGYSAADAATRVIGTNLSGAARS